MKYMKSLKTSFWAMTILVIASNYLVLFPLNDWLTLAAFTYPMTFLVTELTNRTFGSKKAKKVVYLGFILGLVLSVFLANAKIAIASCSAFLISQLLDIYIFNFLRKASWWVAPFFASCLASIVDASIFWTLAFWGESLPILTWAIGDTFIKLLIDAAMLTPFRIAIRKVSSIYEPLPASQTIA